MRTSGSGTRRRRPVLVRSITSPFHAPGGVVLEIEIHIACLSVVSKTGIHPFTVFGLYFFRCTRSPCSVLESSI
jgi:hypothetical protein